jgi:hypothetical protein
MPIKPAVPPVDTFDIIASYVQSLALAPGSHFMNNVPQEELELTAPHRVYVLGFNDIRHKMLSRAAFVGWRFLIVAGDRVIASAESLNDREHSVAVNAGRFVSATAITIDLLENLPEVQAGDFELRILKVNALYLMAVWLTGNRQLIIPLDPAPLFIQAGRQYTERSFFEALDQPGVKPFIGSSGNTMS